MVFKKSKGTPVKNQNLPPVFGPFCVLTDPTWSELLPASPWLLLGRSPEAEPGLGRRSNNVPPLRPDAPISRGLAPCLAVIRLS